MENRVLVTGLGNGILGECAPCNYDAYQLICNPSMLLWIDKIVIPKKILDTITKENTETEGKIVQLIVEFCDRANLIETIDTNQIFKESVKTLLEDAVESDIKALTTLHPELSNVQGDNHFVINYKGMDYCFPRILSLYGDLFLSRLLEANCLFSPGSIEFCHLKFGLTTKNPINTANTFLGVDKILSTIIPSIHPYPGFLNESNDCKTCRKYDDCQLEYFQDLEGALNQYLRWREYDEFYQLRECIDKVVLAARNHSDIIMPDDIFHEFEQEKTRINSLIHRHLPRVKKFSDLITAVSVPATIFSAANSSAFPITVGAAVLSGTSALASVIGNRIEEKYKWVNFSLKG